LARACGCYFVIFLKKNLFFKARIAAAKGLRFRDKTDPAQIDLDPEDEKVPQVSTDEAIDYIVLYAGETLFQQKDRIMAGFAKEQAVILIRIFLSCLPRREALS
jgi:hypothetical protein